MEPKRPLEDWVRASFDAGRDIPFEESAWADLSRQLDRTARRKKRLLILPWFLFLLGLAGSVFFYREMRRAQQTAQAAGGPAVSNKTKTDTLVLEKTRTIRDTVYLYKYRIISADPAVNPAQSAVTGSEGSQPGLEPGRAENRTPDIRQEKDIDGQVSPPAFLKGGRMPGEVYSTRAAFRLWPVRLPDPGAVTPVNTAPSSGRLWLNLEMSGYNPGNGRAVNDTISAFGGHRGGVRALLALNWEPISWLRMHAGAGREFAWFRSTTHQPDEATYPLDFGFTRWGQWESWQDQWSYEAGISGVIPTRLRIKPFAGISLTARSGFQQQLNGEQQSDEVYGPLPYWRRMEFSDPAFRISGWKADVGADYFHPGGWVLGLSGQYFRANKSLDGMKPGWGLGLRLGWGF